MMKYWIAIVWLSVMLVGCDTKSTLPPPITTPTDTRQVQEGVNDVFDLMGVMQAAVPTNREYNASVTFDTHYEAQTYEVFLLNNHTNTIRPLQHGNLQKNRKIDFTFQEQFDQPHLTLIFRLSKAGLQFLIGQPGEFICYLDIPQPFFSRAVVCNESTTALALLAHNQAIDEFTDLLRPSTINRWKRFNGIEQRITLDMFTLVLSLFQTTMIELPMSIPFEERSTSQLPQTADIATSMMAYISENHYLDIRYLENQIAYHYPEMDKLGFILSTSGQRWVDTWHDYFLSSKKRRQLIRQFFRGSNDLVFVDTQAFRVQSPVFEAHTQTLHWIDWPWFESVEIFIDDVSVGLVQDGKWTLDTDQFQHVTFKPLGKLGKFQTIKLTKTALLERYDQVLEQDTFGGAYVSQ